MVYCSTADKEQIFPYFRFVFGRRREKSCVFFLGLSLPSPTTLSQPASPSSWRESGVASVCLVSFSSSISSSSSLSKSYLSPGPPLSLSSSPFSFCENRNGSRSRKRKKGKAKISGTENEGGHTRVWHEDTVTLLLYLALPPVALAH